MNDQKRHKGMISRWMPLLLCLLFMAQWEMASGQEQTPSAGPASTEALEALSEGATDLAGGSFAEAEVNYRKALALGERDNGAFNLGNEYHLRGQNKEALFRFKQAARDATTYEQKHRAFHNLGNAFMKEKKYQEAVAAYKDALRNSPKDDESRYNLAVAQDLLDKNPPPPDENKDDKKDQQDKQDQDQQQDQEKDGQNQDDPSKNDQDQDKNDQGENQNENEGDGQKDSNKDQGEQKNKNQKPEDQDKNKNPNQGQPGKLSPQQIKNLLEAMNNEEQKVQDKMNLQKVKGAKVKRSKDW
ncbi:MAG: tetratricopeptide repeat protein [Flavobacteriaceae bacterium]|nr:tetratricopeptide repeat protein [Flavobacteriaceae bacterium]